MNPHVPPDVLSALIDGECGPEERRDVHEHLQECSPCSRTVREYLAVRALVARLERRPAPESLVRAVLHPPPRAADVLRAVLRGPRKYVAAAVAAGAVAVSLAGLAAPAEQQQPPMDVFVARHASVSAGTDASAPVIFAVLGR